MNIISKKGTICNSESKTCDNFIARFKMKAMLRGCGFVKKCGVDVYVVFSFLMNLVFTRKNLFRHQESEDMGFGKDVVYRLLNGSGINWESLLAKTACSVIPEVRKLTEEQRRCVLIVDDTPLYRDRSKKVELLSRCYDHCEKRYYNGFYVMALGWSDGVTFMPVDYRLLSSSDDDILVESAVAEDKRTIETKRRNDAKTPKPQLLLKMLKNVKGTPAECRYVLMDSWYATPQCLADVKNAGYDAIGRLKNDKTLYTCGVEPLSLRKIFNSNKKRRGKSRYLLSVYATVERNGGLLPLKLVFVRNRNKRSEYIVFASTDTALTEEEIITLYGKRWGIETFFKVCKSNLRMEKEFQSRSFDAIAGHVAIVFIRYIMLSVASRENIDERSVCAIFHAVCDELPDINLQDALNLVAQLMNECIAAFQKANRVSLEGLYAQFFNALPDYIKEKLAA